MFVSKKDLASLRSSMQSEFDKKLQSLRDTNNDLKNRLEKCEKELGIAEEKQQESYSIWYSWMDVITPGNTKPSLKNRILALEKYLGGNVSEIQSKKEIKFIPVKKSKKSKK